MQGGGARLCNKDRALGVFCFFVRLFDDSTELNATL